MTRDRPDLSAIAASVQRLAVLLAAGTAPAAAWHYLDGDGVVASVAGSLASGVDVPDAIAAATKSVDARERTIWRTVAAAWSVASVAGAPLAATLSEIAEAIRDLAATQREIAIALASPRATARLVLVLPAVGLVFGALLGFNTIGTLVMTPIGWCCLAVGGGLQLVAVRWNRRMVRAAEPRDPVPGIELDLLAIALSGGAGMERARSILAEAARRYLGREHRDERSVEAVLSLSRRAGVPAAALLRTEAVELRREARASASERAQALSIRLMIPLGLCVLPAFLVMSVVPLVVAVLASSAPVS